MASEASSEALDTLDAILAGLHTLGSDAEAVEKEELRNRLTGAVGGLRAAVLTARGQVLHMEEQYEAELAQSRQHAPDPRPGLRQPTPRMKWGCYQFDDAEGLFCAACSDKRNRRVRTVRHNSDNLVCPNCRTLFPVK
jgi:hypothetical protein